jgi:hypothetical protein
METFAVTRSVFFRSIYNGRSFLTFPRLGCVLPRPQCHPAPEGAVTFVSLLRYIVALMSGILISVRKFILPKCLASRQRDVRHLRYDIHFSLPSLEFRTFFFFRGGRKPAAGPQRTLELSLLSVFKPSVRVRVTLRLTVCQSACLCVEPRLGLMTRY